MLSRLSSGACVAVVVIFFAACSSKSSDDGAAQPASTTGGLDASPVQPSATVEVQSTIDASTTKSAESVDAGEPAPAVQFIGRFDRTTPASPKAAWPGSRIVARFEGTAVSVTLSQSDGSSGGPSWFNVIVDGAFTKKVAVASAGQVIALATGLTPGMHVVELEKRTEANLGTITFEGFTFPSGGQLASPPPRHAHRIEFLADSTIDGFGIEGDVSTTCAGGEPAELDDVGKSTAAILGTALEAESHVIAYSGKGIVMNEPGDDGETYPTIYTRTLPDAAGSAWDFASWSPDVVVISLGGTDVTSDTPPAGFDAAYDALVMSVRARHPAAHVYMTVWSQIKDLGAGADVRSALSTSIAAVKAAHPTDAKLHVFIWPEANHAADETGCAQHANAAHAVETAGQLAISIRADLGWN